HDESYAYRSSPLLFFQILLYHRDLHSFPTRRSSDLTWDLGLGTTEGGRKPIEELRMSRLLAADAEVVRCADDPFGEVVLPDAVDQHACDQRVLGRRHLFRQLQATTAVRRRVARGTTDGLEVAARDDLAHRAVVAADVD